MKLVNTLCILLSISLGANLWFLWRWSEQTSEHNSLNQHDNISIPDKSTSQSNSTADTIANKSASMSHLSVPSVTQIIHDLAQNIDYSTKSIEQYKKNKETYLAYLNALVREQNFDTLEFEVSNYLRLYPQDIEALMLEAKAYYHNKPLSIALVHYQALLSKNLNAKQRAEIEKIIAVNTTRVVQQFSGDGAWDLLAAFLEPLVQIDPLNRQYLMALARAYGMQQQFTLMEDVLATFANNDPRANNLRETILARLNQQPKTNRQQGDLPFSNRTDNFGRVADLALKQTRGHFVTKASINNTNVNLLVDTGASTTAISQQKFSDIAKRNVEFLGLFRVNTAGGIIQAPIYKLESFKLGDQTLNNTSVLILPTENLGQYDGLLGMNVLSQFDLTIDANNQTMQFFKK